MERAERAERAERTQRVAVISGFSVLCLLSACAKMEPPPGGPPDLTPPQLIAVRPESLQRIPNFSGDVEFRFNEVISEGGSPSQGAGTGDLERLIILSPTTRVPEVRWRRNRITVKPSDGWKTNRVYRVELLPGVTDLRRNRSNKGAVLTFTTGADLPSRTLQGLVVDWSTNRPAAQALVEALLLPDSLPYHGLTDSTGRFSLGPLPAGEYLVKGVIDQNHDFQPSPREAFDSIRILSTDTTGRVGELWTFVHDTAAARIRTITVADSVSARVEFSQFLDPRQKLALTSVTLRSLPDSAAVKVTSLLPKPLDDSLHERAPAAPDSTARDTTRRDTTARERPGLREIEAPGARLERQGANQPLTTRPQLTDQLVLRVPQPWKPEGKYELELRGVRNVSGVSGDVKGVLTVPKVEPRDTLRGRGDSLAPPGDSLKRLKKRS
jgi:Big-like domain-containing protein